MVLKLVISTMAMLALTACASIRGASGASAPSASVIQAQLSPQILEPGSCGLFVWSANAQRQFVMFVQDSAGRAVWFNGANDETLSIASTNGVQAYGQWPEQSFTSQTGTTLSLNLSSAQSIETGLRYKSGLLTVNQTGQWPRHVPVVGFAACLDVLV